MFYYSDYNQPCVKNASYGEWCNVPNKARFNPTEQMIVAYHTGTTVYAYVTRSAKRALIAFPIIHVWLIVTPNLLTLSPCNYTHNYCQVRVVE